MAKKRIRELTRKAGTAVVQVWPPIWASSFGAGSKLAVGDDGVLESVARAGDRLSLTVRYDSREHVGGLQWDSPPSIEEVEKVLRDNIGREIRAISDVEVY